MDIENITITIKGKYKDIIRVKNDVKDFVARYKGSKVLVEDKHE